MHARPKRARISRPAPTPSRDGPKRLTLCASALLATGCLSLNDQFAHPLSASTEAGDPSQTTPPAGTTSSDTPSGVQVETTDDPNQSSDSETTTNSSQVATSSSTRNETSSATTGANTTTTGTNPDTTPKSCQNPTLCDELNAGRTINRLIAAPFDAFAVRFPRDENTLNLARVDVYTGSVTGSSHVVSVHADGAGAPGAPVRKEYFSATVIQRWYATTFDPPIQISVREPHWVSWAPPGGTLGSSASFGITISGQQKLRESSNWEARGYPIMMRLYCCP